MIDWKNKEPGYYTPEGELILTWQQLKKNRTIGFYGQSDGFHDDDSHLRWVRYIEPAGGVLVFANTVTDIVSDAFKYVNVSGVVLNEGVQSLWDRAFCHCRNMEFIILPATITHIGRSAFRECESLKSFDLNAPIKYLDGLTFAYCGLETVHIQSSVLTYIDERAFDMCTDMHTCIIDAPIKHVGMMAFRKCWALKEYNKINTLTSIHGWAFDDCTTIDKLAVQKFKSYFEKNGITDESERERLRRVGIKAVDLFLNY
jgi:hypothetical protein